MNETTRNLVTKIDISMEQEQNLENKEEKKFEDDEAQSTYELNNNSEICIDPLNESKLIKTQMQQHEVTPMTKASNLNGQVSEPGSDLHLELDSNFFSKRKM